MTGEITTALKRWSESGHGHAVVFGPEQITRWRTQNRIVEDSDTYEVPTGGWTQVEAIANPLGVVPVVPLGNRPRLLSPNGETELSDIIPLTDAVSKVCTDMLVTSKHAAAPRRWITGMDVANQDEGERAAALVEAHWTDAPASKLWIAGAPETKFRQFPEATLDGFVAATDTLTQRRGRRAPGQGRARGRPRRPALDRTSRPDGKARRPDRPAAHRRPARRRRARRRDQGAGSRRRPRAAQAAPGESPTQRRRRAGSEAGDQAGRVGGDAAPRRLSHLPAEAARSIVLLLRRAACKVNYLIDRDRALDECGRCPGRESHYAIAVRIGTLLELVGDRLSGLCDGRDDDVSLPNVTTLVAAVDRRQRQSSRTQGCLERSRKSQRRHALYHAPLVPDLLQIAVIRSQIRSVRHGQVRSIR